MNQGSQFGGYALTGAQRPGRMMALLRQATGLEVVPDPWAGGALLWADAALGTKTVQRIVLNRLGEELLLSTSPAELKPQAEALYRTQRVRHLTDFLARRSGEWRPGSTPISPSVTRRDASGSTSAAASRWSSMPAAG